MDSATDDQHQRAFQDFMATFEAFPNTKGIDWTDATALLAPMFLDYENRRQTSTRPESDVRQEAEARSETIYTSYDTLHKILERHEATISKRWLKRTRQQRLKVLLEAWPAGYAEFQTQFCKRPEKRLRWRGCLIWPYINQEDLVSPKTLLLLLNSRGRHPPSSFAASDMDEMHLGLVIHALMPDVVSTPGYMALNGFADNTRQYGEFVTYDGNEEELRRMTRKQFMPGEGLLILEAQARLLTFLVQCCRQLLPDIPVDNFDCFPILPPPQTKSESELSGFESLRLMAAEASYRVPGQLDLSRIESLLAARTAAAEDHLWALREDPEYFASAVLETREHRPEMLKDLQGRDHPHLRSNRGNVFWARILRSVILQAYVHVDSFSELSQQARFLVSLQHQYASQITPSQDLPEEFLDALLRFRHGLSRSARDRLHLMQAAFRHSPQLRKFFVCRPRPNLEDVRHRDVTMRPGVKRTAVEKKLLWLYEHMIDSDEVMLLAGVPLIMDELERLLENEPGARDLISPVLAGLIGDLSILAQCLKQLALYQPWARSWLPECMARRQKFDEDLKKLRKGWDQILDVMAKAFPETGDGSRAIVLGNPSGGSFAYPIDKRRTKENVEILRRAEARLDAFWGSIEEAMQDSVRGTPFHKALFSQSRSLHRTPEWKEPSPRPQPQLQPQLQLASQSKNDGIRPYTPFEAIAPTSPNWLSTSSANDNSTAEPPKVKVKTRGTARPASTPQDHDTEALPEPIGAEVQPIFSVNARALKVFRGLFHDQEVSSTLSEVRWSDFLHAMRSIGFAGTKLYGSVWQFQPTGSEFERSIQFHEPHHGGKLPHTAARRFGRRLNRAYGWHGGMFVLAEK